ncbi:MAG: type II toxin-antitoxin system HicB family antitoxin [Methylobacter sp.]|nr:type II toxin-antitoxin system HicB family antitoxin [Methylobacter sp.]
MNFHIEYEREADGRWLAEVPEIPGVLTYGDTADEAKTKRCLPRCSASAVL